MVIDTVAGAVWPVLARLPSFVLRLANVVVFAVVTVELLPETQRTCSARGTSVRDVVLGFVLGVPTTFAVDNVLDRVFGDEDGHEHADSGRSAAVNERLRNAGFLRGPCDISGSASGGAR